MYRESGFGKTNISQNGKNTWEESDQNSSEFCIVPPQLEDPPGTGARPDIHKADFCITPTFHV